MSAVGSQGFHGMNVDMMLRHRETYVVAQTCVSSFIYLTNDVDQDSYPHPGVTRYPPSFALFPSFLRGFDPQHPTGRSLTRYLEVSAGMVVVVYLIVRRSDPIVVEFEEQSADSLLYIQQPCLCLLTDKIWNLVAILMGLLLMSSPGFRSQFYIKIVLEKYISCDVLAVCIIHNVKVQITLSASLSDRTCMLGCLRDVFNGNNPNALSVYQISLVFPSLLVVKIKEKLLKQSSHE